MRYLIQSYIFHGGQGKHVDDVTMYTPYSLLIGYKKICRNLKE